MRTYLLVRENKKELPRVKIDRRNQIMIPPRTIKRFGLAVGEELTLIESNQAIMLVPQKRVSKNQRWYYTKKWQKMMREAFEDLAEGMTSGPFENADDLIRDLRT